MVTDGGRWRFRWAGWSARKPVSRYFAAFQHTALHRQGTADAVYMTYLAARRLSARYNTGRASGTPALLAYASAGTVGYVANGARLIMGMHQNASGTFHGFAVFWHQLSLQLGQPDFQ